jgi:hypothetical protein
MPTSRVSIVVADVKRGNVSSGFGDTLRATAFDCATI